MAITTDVPDWQRFQSSMGQPLLDYDGAGPVNTSVIYVGPWRAWFMQAFTNGGTGVWRVSVNWSTDAAGINVIRTDFAVVGNSVVRIGFRPIFAQYMQITATLTVPSAGDNIAITIYPTLLESLIGARGFGDRYLRAYEAILNHNNFVDLDGVYSMPGPALLTVRANVYGMAYDVKVMEDDGTWTTLMRYQGTEANLAVVYPLTLPDQPVRVTSSNFATFAKATYDVLLSPA